MIALKARIPIVSDRECEDNVFRGSLGLHNLYSLSPGQLCAGDISNVRGPCEVCILPSNSL